MQSMPEASLELFGRVIILDAGHGTGTTNVYAGYDEQATMLKLAQKIKPLLESRGATVHLTRTSSETVPLSVRAAKTNIWALEALKAVRQQESGEGSDLPEGTYEIDRLLGIMQSIIDDPAENGGIYMNAPFVQDRSIHPDLKRIFEYQDDPEIMYRFLVISLHSDASRRPVNTSLSGATALHISNTHRNTSKYYTGYSYVGQSRHFGGILLNNIAAAGIRNRGVEIENYFLIREHNLPGVLVENGFHTNAGDRAKLMSDSFLDSLALAYLDAITIYFNELPLPDSFPSLPYTDVRYGAWYFDAVKHVTERGLLVGTGNARFSPSSGVTRAMLTTVLARLGKADVLAYAETPYTDVSIDAWYGKTVAWAADMGIVAFIEGESFGPEQEATREEIALMLYIFFRLAEQEPPTEPKDAFIDDGDISPWAKTAVYAIQERGIMQGDDLNRFNPQNTVTRAEVSQILFNIES